MQLKEAKNSVIFLLIISFCSFAFKIPEKPIARVNDFAKILSSDFIIKLEAFLKKFEDISGNQLVVVTIQSLDGEDIESFSIKLAEMWKIGKKDLDNGIILLVALKERAIRIEVGYGLEDKLTDAKCAVIINRYIVPYFKNGDFENGIAKGVQKIIENLTSDSIDDSGYISSEKENHNEPQIFLVLAILFIFIFIVDIIRYSFVKKRFNFFEWFLLFSITFFLIKLFLSGRSYGGGSRGFRSFGGGGFSGGGGRFGGGGASGRW